MPPSSLAPSTSRNPGAPGSSLYLRRQFGSFIVNVRGSWASDSNATGSGIAGPGLPLGQLFSAAGRRLEVVIDRTAARAGWGFEGIARRLLMKMCAPHARCRAGPDFAKTSIVNLAIELGSGHCHTCGERYIRVLSIMKAQEIGELLLRLVPSIESDLPANRTTGSMLLTALALSDDIFLAALRESEVLQRVELALHSCKIFTVQDDAWLPALRAVYDLRQVLVSLVPVEPFMVESYSDERVLHLWHDIDRRASIVKTQLKISPLMSRCWASRLESTITADQDLLQQLCIRSNQKQLDALYVHMLSACLDGKIQYAGKLLSTAVLVDRHVTPALLATLLQKPLLEVITVLKIFVDARVLLTLWPLESITDTTTLCVCHGSLRGFLVNPQRCLVKQYLISPGEDNEALLHRCLCLLNTSLRQDICRIRNPGLANADVPNLSARISRFLPEAVGYACVSWPIHLLASGPISDTVSALLLEFCTHHLLHWLEVTSLLGQVGITIDRLCGIKEWCEGQIHFTHMTSMRAISVRLSDAYEALQVYAEPIASHALQVYQSVSATGPTCRLLDWVESSRVVTPRLVSQRTSNWRALREWHEGPSHVSCIAYSPDGSRIASGSNDGNVRVWDAQTGKQLSVMEGCNSSVYSMMSGIKLAWNIDAASIPISVEGRIADLPRTPTDALVWNKGNGWISWQHSAISSVRLCWVPLKYRGDSYASHGMSAAFGAEHDGTVTILDFSEVIAWLISLDQAPSV